MHELEFTPKGNEAQAGDAHLSLPATAQLPWVQSSSLILIPLLPAPTLFCSESKTCSEFVVQGCDFIPSCPGGEWQQFYPRSLLLSAAAVPVLGSLCPSPSVSTGVLSQQERCHHHPCGSAVMPRWQQGPTRCSQVHKHFRVFNRHGSLPLVVSFHSAVSLASGEVSVIHSL